MAYPIPQGARWCSKHDTLLTKDVFIFMILQNVISVWPVFIKNEINIVNEWQMAVQVRDMKKVCLECS